MLMPSDAPPALLDALQNYVNQVKCDEKGHEHQICRWKSQDQSAFNAIRGLV